MNLERFARLITLMHNEGIDLKLIDIGTSLVEKMTVDETIQSENDLADVRMMLSKQSKVAAEGKIVGLFQIMIFIFSLILNFYKIFIKFAKNYFFNRLIL